MAFLALIGFLSLFLLVALIRIFHKQWWTPKRIQRLMASQGINGPPYKLIHGSTKEIMSFKKKAMEKPFGLSHDIFPRVQPHVYRWTKTYGRCYLQWYGPEAALVITETELIKEILNDRQRLFNKPEPEPFFKKIVGDGVSSSKGEKWAKMRKLATHAFQGECLKGMIPAMIISAEEMLGRWKDRVGKEIDVHEEFRLLTSEVISRTAFGSGYLEGKAIFEMLVNLASLAARNKFKRRFPGISKVFKSADENEAEKLEKGIRDSIVQMIKKREEKVMNGEEDGFGSDFLGELIKVHHNTDEKQAISVDEMVDECKTFYFGGQETTNSLLSWTVFLLAVHTDWQEEARKEVLDLFGKQIPKPDGISKLKSLSMIINESLRLYPPLISVSRKSEREVRLGNLNIPANVTLEISTLAVHHDPQIWGDDVHLFKPERFSGGVAKATKDNFAAFLPFGMGPRVCLGFNFVMAEVKVALAMILQRYTVTLSPAYVHSPIQFLAARPQNGVQVILHPL